MCKGWPGHNRPIEELMSKSGAFERKDSLLSAMRVACLPVTAADCLFFSPDTELKSALWENCHTT